MSGGKGKRVSSSPLASSSDEEGTAEKDGPANDSVSDSREQDKTLLAVDTSGPSPTLPDHDYEAAHSPGDSSSSTTSEPSYIRQPGFTHHAHRVVCYPKAKKKRIFIATVKGQKHREPIPPKSRPRRGKQTIYAEILISSSFEGILHHWNIDMSLINKSMSTVVNDYKYIIHGCNNI